MTQHVCASFKTVSSCCITKMELVRGQETTVWISHLFICTDARINLAVKRLHVLQENIMLRISMSRKTYTPTHKGKIYNIYPLSSTQMLSIKKSSLVLYTAHRHMECNICLKPWVACLSNIIQLFLKFIIMESYFYDGWKFLFAFDFNLILLCI